MAVDIEVICSSGDRYRGLRVSNFKRKGPCHDCNLQAEDINLYYLLRRKSIASTSGRTNTGNWPLQTLCLR